MATPRQTQGPERGLSLIEKNKWFIGLLVGGLVNTGVMWQQFQEVQKRLEETRVAEITTATRLSEFREKQIGGLQDIEVLKSTVKNLDSRVLVIERVFIERNPATLPERTK